MKHEKRTGARNEKLTRRIISVLIAVIMITVSVPMLSAGAAGDDPYTTQTVYHWKRVRTQNDIRSGYLMICWGDYYSGGDSTSGIRFNGRALNSDPFIDTSADDFYTLTTCDAWSLVLSGTDGDNGNMKKARIYRNDGSLLHVPSNKISWSSNKTDSNDQFTFSTSEVDCDYADETGSGMVQILHNRSGKDRYLDPKGNQLTVNESYSYDYPDFKVFIGVAEKFTALGDYTVSCGQTFQLKDNVILKNGCTLTIEPGGMLSVEGLFYNNGTIQNLGNMILERNSCVTFLDPDNSNCGHIYCKGGDYTVTKKQKVSDSETETVTMHGEGNLIILEGAKLVLPSLSTDLVIYKGACCVNNGIMIIPGGITMYGGELINNPGGTFITGYMYCNSYGSIRASKLEKVVNMTVLGTTVRVFIGLNGLSAVNGAQMNYTQSRNHVESSGNWYVYGTNNGESNTVFNIK